MAFLRPFTSSSAPGFFAAARTSPTKTHTSLHIWNGHAAFARLGYIVSSVRGSASASVRAVATATTTATTMPTFGPTGRLYGSDGTSRLSALQISERLNRLSALEGDTADLVGSLHDLVKSGVFALDDRVQAALGRLRSLAPQVGDHGTLLRAAEILRDVGDHASLVQMLSFYAADFPFMPTAVLVDLLRLCSGLSAAGSDSEALSRLTGQLRDQLWLNITSFYSVGAFGAVNAITAPINPTISTSNAITATNLESLLFCYDRINDPRMPYHCLTGVDFSTIDRFDELLSAFKLYFLFVRDGNGPIDGLISAGLDRFEALLGSSAANTPSTAKHILSCYRALTKIKRYEPLVISTDLFGSTIAHITPLLADMRPLVLLFRDLCYYQLDSPSGTADELIPITSATVDALFDNIAHLSKDHLVLMVRMLSKLINIATSSGHGTNGTTGPTPQNSGLPLSPTHLELLNTQLSLHLSDFTSNELLAIVKCYLTLPRTPEAVSLMASIYDRLSNGIASIGPGSSIGSGSLSHYADTNDPNISVYAMSRLLLYFNDIAASPLNGSVPHQQQHQQNGNIGQYCPAHVGRSVASRLKGYVRGVSRSHISLSSKTLAYCLYTLYRVGHHPVALVRQLLPALHRGLEASPDLVQALLFFSKYRHGRAYDSITALLRRRVAEGLARGAFNVRQLVVLCLLRHGRVFAAQLFGAIAARLADLAPSQLCTVYGACVRAGFVSHPMLSELTRLLRSNIAQISAQDAVNLLMPIKNGHLTDPQVVDRVRSLPLDPSDLFDVFGLIPAASAGSPHIGVGDATAGTATCCDTLTDRQVVRCLLFLGDKQRSPEIDAFARRLYARVVKLAPALSPAELRAVLASIRAYGFSKPKVVRVLSSLLAASVPRTHRRTDATGPDSSARPARSPGAAGARRSPGRTGSSPSDPGASPRLFRPLCQGPPHLSVPPRQ